MTRTAAVWICLFGSACMQNGAQDGAPTDALLERSSIKAKAVDNAGGDCTIECMPCPDGYYGRYVCVDDVAFGCWVVEMECSDAVAYPATAWVRTSWRCECIDEQGYSDPFGEACLEGSAR